MKMYLLLFTLILLIVFCLLAGLFSVTDKDMEGY
jgi:hypothetical protein